MLMLIKMVSAVTVFVMSMLTLSVQSPEKKCNPEFTGTFIQSWMTYAWESA